MKSKWSMQRYMRLLLLMLTTVGGKGLEVDNIGTLVEAMIQHDIGCHLVLLTTIPYSPFFSALHRSLDVSVIMIASNIPFDDQLLVGMWGDSTTTCRILLLDIGDESNSEASADLNDDDVRRMMKNSSNIISIASKRNMKGSNDYKTSRHTSNWSSNEMIPSLSLLEQAGLWKLPETRVFVVGSRTGGESVLLHHAFRNTKYGVYLSFNYHSMSWKSLHMRGWHGVSAFSSYYNEVVGYSRCLFCKDGQEDVRFSFKTNISSQNIEDPTDFFNKDSKLRNFLFVYRDTMRNFKGHKMKIVSVSHFPYVDYTLDTDLPGSTVTLKDSVDARLIISLSEKLNFTYVVREEPERAFGLVKNGQFDGIMGQLQREESDFSTLTGPTPSRIKVMDYVHSYPPDKMTITSLKPSYLPQHTAMIRPFSGEVWLSIGISVVVWAVILWLLNLAGARIVGVQNVGFSTSLLYGWGTLVERPPAEPSITVSVQLLAGSWLVFCLIICTGFKSSLIAHLTVQGTSAPIETLEDLVEADGWRWGIAAWLLKGIPREYFSKHTDPIVKEVYRNLEAINADLALKEIKMGGYSLFHFERYITIMIASYYTDIRGQTPYFISKKGIPLATTFGWSFRIGAPYTDRFRSMMLYLEDMGIINYWMQDVIAMRVKENRKAMKLDISTEQIETTSDEREVVLGLQHMQGAFYVLFLGCGIAIVILLIEVYPFIMQQEN